MYSHLLQLVRFQYFPKSKYKDFTPLVSSHWFLPQQYKYLFLSITPNNYKLRNIQKIPKFP